MRLRGRTDANQSAIVSALRKVGCRVVDMSPLGGGVPDLLVSLPRRKALPDLVLMEVKTARGRLTRDQQTFEAAGWPVFVVRSVAEALRIVGVQVQ